MKNKKGRVILVTGGVGIQGSETCRIPRFLDNRLTDGVEIVSLTYRPRFTPLKEGSCTLEAEWTPGPKCGWKK
jgi:hypothetical protein